MRVGLAIKFNSLLRKPFGHVDGLTHPCVKFLAKSIDAMLNCVDVMVCKQTLARSNEVKL